MNTYSYPHNAVHIALLTNVSNSPSLRQRIVSAPTSTQAERDSLNFAFVDARLITSILHLKTAIYQAILAESQGTLRTKTIHSEVLWALNPTTNITEAIRRYGVSDATTSLFVVRIATQSLSDVEAAITTVVHGQLTPFSALENITDWAAIKKYHKLNTEPVMKTAVGDLTCERATMDNIVISSVAMKSVLT